MRNLLFGIALLICLSLTAVTGSISVLAAGLAIGAFFFGVLLYEQLQELPKINLLALIGIGTGLFYFGGAAALYVMRLITGDNQFMYIFAVWRNYEPLAMVRASILVFGCSALAVLASRYYRPKYLDRIMTREEFHKLLPNAGRDRETLISYVTLAGISALCALLIATGKLTVSAISLPGAQDDSASQWVVLANLAAPAMVALVAELFLRERASYRERALTLALGAAIFAALFILGRRTVIASGFMAIMAWLAFRRVRMTPVKWLGFAAGGLLIFFVISGPFLAIRSAQRANQVVGIGDLFSSYTGGHALGSAKYSLADIAMLSAARADIMGELSQIVSNFHMDRIHFGGAFLSQLGEHIPSFLWHGKKTYMLTTFYDDFRVCDDAGLPRTDLAGSLVLYSFVELGWGAPIWFLLMATSFIWISDRMIGIFGSYTLYLLTLSTLVTYALIADAGFGAQILGDLRFLLLTAVLLYLMRFLLSWDRNAHVNHPRALTMQRARH